MQYNLLNYYWYAQIVIVWLIVMLAHRTRVFSATLEMLRWFAGQQIRNVSVSYFAMSYF